jgi:cytochrome b561
MADGDGPAYTRTARTLHWVIAAFVLTTIPMGIVMMRIDSGGLQDFLFQLHKSIGIAVLLLMTARLVYRWTHRPLPLPADVPALQRFAAETVHWTLYALLLVQPIVGWIATSAYPAPFSFFGLFPVPSIWRVDQPFAERLFFVHQLIGYLIGLLLCAHIGGVLFHHFVRKDRVLMRMASG